MKLWGGAAVARRCHRPEDAGSNPAPTTSTLKGGTACLRTKERSPGIEATPTTPKRIITHHFLFQKRHWSQGYAKALREHPYMGKMIPRNTLHRALHSKIHDVPVPNGKDCKRAFEELIRREREGLIDVEHDTCESRLDFLIELWRDTCPATVAILEWQKDVIYKFYEERCSK